MQGQTFFVTGATGLLGNNLVRALLSRGATVRALARSRAKAAAQFDDIRDRRLEIVTGDMENVASFARHLEGVDALFHTAAYFRDSYKGGSHWPMLERINVIGTRDLIAAARAADAERARVHAQVTAAMAPGIDAELAAWQARVRGNLG